MKTALTLTALVLASASMGVAAETMGAEDAFNQLDADGDGVLTQDETNVDLLLAEQFEMLDADGSGDLSMEEFETFYTESETTEGK